MNVHLDFDVTLYYPSNVIKVSFYLKFIDFMKSRIASVAS